jgi:hypothetical protein
MEAKERGTEAAEGTGTKIAEAADHRRNEAAEDEQRNLISARPSLLCCSCDPVPSVTSVPAASVVSVYSRCDVVFVGFLCASKNAIAPAMFGATTSLCSPPGTSTYV